MPGDPILPELYDDLRFKRDVAARDAAEARAPQLVFPIISPFAPFGGASPPTGLWYIAVTSAIYGVEAAQPWVSRPDRLVRRAVLVRVPWTTDAATTGALKLVLPLPPAGSNVQTSAVVLPAASSGTQTFRWLHGVTPWTQIVAVNVEAIRTGGAGNVNIGAPEGGLIQVDPAGATVTGL